jgi:hypothetical protein
VNFIGNLSLDGAGGDALGEGALEDQEEQQHG